MYLDEEGRDGLRDLFERSRPGNKPQVVAKPQQEQAPVAQVSLDAPPSEPAVVPAVSRDESGSREERLAALRSQAENWQPAKELGTLRDTMVFSTGNPQARLMLVGEAPGYQEEREREPFVGPAGQKLNDILKAMGVSREEVYISNIVKFRPATPNQTTNNRKPTPEEMASCMPFVRAEIEIVQPECIVALGGTAAEGLLGLEGTVTSMRGSWHDFEGTPVRVSYHPSYLLQSGSSSTAKRSVWEDMLAVMEKLELPISEKQRGYFLPKK
ncbi:uracil-DNA glycosylase [Luteolibacter pohnpeiensis]|uniref:Type-4 uracil-DNA glycosylase n=2 Tax=Luteolibacter pohnpeiensis TaxID=454153 RepID=A0A934S6S9_9BACT|nr:uracil-DNA glycosylase [Luteolibacter pohnpeiensis]